jgi:hypothetical protein
MSELTLESASDSTQQANTNENSDMKMRSFRKKLQNGFEIFFRWLFFWERDDKRLGTLIRALHQLVLMALIVFFCLIHTVIPNYIYLFLLWLTSFIIWALHMLTGSCVLTKIEHKLTGEKITVADPFLDLFHIPKTKETIMGITIMSSTVFFLFLSFELIARTVLNVRSYWSKSFLSFLL